MPNPLLIAVRRALVPGVLLLSLLGAAQAPAATAGTDRLPHSGSMVPGYPIRAKDFAFIREGEYFHIFWIRNDPTVPFDSTERDLGHAISRDLQTWTQLPPVLAARPDKWDNLHIWAPTIVKRGRTFYMYYTGVSRAPEGGTPVQRIGLATSTDLLDWTRYDQPVLSAAMIPWAYSDTTRSEGCQFRDPFVMDDPTTPDRTLLYYVTTPAAATNQVIVGVAQTTDMVHFTDLMPLWCTDAANSWGSCESPHVTAHGGLYYLFASLPVGRAVCYRTATSPLADSAAWSGMVRLYDIADQDPVAGMLFASEVLSIPGHDYLAAVNPFGYRIDIYEIAWEAAPQGISLATPVVPQPSSPAPPHAGLALAAVANPEPGTGVRLHASLPVAAEARIDLFDLGGRRVRTLRPGVLPEGDSETAWDGRLGDGARAPSGVYFAVLIAAGGRCSARVPVIN